MRYFTKEWVKQTIVADMCFQLHQSPKAAVYDEKYFQSLYNTKFKSFTHFEKRKAKILHIPFDKEGLVPAFAALFDENLTFIKENIPSEILDKVADIRVLALGEASYDMVHEITRYCGKVDRACKAVQDDYDNALEDLAEKIGWYKINSLELLLNSALVRFEQTDNGNLTLSFHNDVSNADNTLTLQDAKLLSGETNPDAHVLYYEITDEGDSLAFGMLCQNNSGNLFDFSAKMQELELV